MFTHSKKLQYKAQPEKADPVMARRLQDILGGQWGEMTGMVSYLYQGWNATGYDQYKDLLLDTGTEEIGHVEMIATMVTRLLRGASTEEQEKFYNSGDPALQAAMNGTDPQQAVVNGLGAGPTDANGNPWTAAYAGASGNLLADMRYNVVRESMARVSVTRLYHMTEDKGVRDMLSYLMGRETQHQLQFLQAAEELEEKYGVVVPHGTKDLENQEVSHTLYSFSDGDASRAVVEGKTARDGEPFKYHDGPLISDDLQDVGKTIKEMHNTEGQEENKNN